MPAPSTVSEFLDLVQKSGVVDEKKLDTYVEKLRAAQALPDDPGKFAGLLVRDGLLTQFQAEQVLLGKWRRFTIGKYKVLEKLGSGGMGSVFLCEHKLMRRRVAVKVLPAAKADDTSSLERFYREARAVAALDHPNIVRAYDIDQDEKLHFLVMEYVDGSSLQDLIKKSGPLDVVRAAHYMRQAAHGLQHAHEAAGLVHRDIKPGNILVDRNGIVKVLDMGLARFFNDEEDILTKKYDENVLGTADYLAPEQALDSHAVDIRADVYSLGGTFYFCLTGRTPFNEGTVAQKLIWHQTRQPKPIRTLRADVPEGIVAVVEKMMAKDPAGRYQTPTEVAEALAPWTQTPIPPPTEAEMPHLCPAAMGTMPMLSDSSTTTVPLSPGGPTPAPTRTWQVAVTPSPKPSTNAPPGPVSPPPGRVPPPAPAPRQPDVRSTPAPRTPTAPGPQQPARAPGFPGSVPTVGAPTPTARLTPAKNGAIATVPTTSRAANAPAREASAEEENAPWDHLGSADTADLAKQADTAPRSGKKRAPGGARASGESRRTAAESGRLKKDAGKGRLWVVITAVAVVLLVGGGVIAFLALSGFLTPKVDERQPLVVNRTRGPFKSLYDALQRAKPSDRIVIEEPEIAEPIVFNDGKLGAIKVADNVTIEPEAGKTVRWQAPEKAAPGDRLLVLSGVAKLRLRKIIFDGKGKVDELLMLTGKCPGVTVEECQFEGFRKNAILVINCEGESGQPVVLERLEIRTTQPADGIVFDAKENVTPKVNQHITLRDCRFAGPFQLPLKKVNKGEWLVETKDNLMSLGGTNPPNQPVPLPPK